MIRTQSLSNRGEFLDLGFTGEGRKRQLLISAPSPYNLMEFEGVVADSGGGVVIEGPLSSVNAAAIRTVVPWLQPKRIGQHTSVGVGDRLGLATPGHVRAFRKYGPTVTPVFAQQSIREMDRLGRSPQAVMDDATFGLVEAGWSGSIGADADHLKTNADISRCLEAGFTLFTIDPGDFVRTVPLTFDGDLSDIPWEALEDNERAVRRRYRDLTLELEHTVLRVEESDLLRAVYKYGPALAHAFGMYRHLVSLTTYPVEVEIAVDETEEPTSLVEHLYMATEMKRLGIRWVSFAPRYVGRFEKGVEYIGDLDVFEECIRDHAQIASALGPYKLSLHSGSDKFSIYERAVRATEGMVHLKTSGTSYLAALGIAAECAPPLFREIYDISRDAYGGARASYQVSAAVNHMVPSTSLSDIELAHVLTQFDSRQILHVGYGAALTSVDETGNRRLYDALRLLLDREAERYADALEFHIGCHLKPFDHQGGTPVGPRRTAPPR